MWIIDKGAIKLQTMCQEGWTPTYGSKGIVVICHVYIYCCFINLIIIINIIIVLLLILL